MTEVNLSWTEVNINVDKEEELLYLLDAGQGQIESFGKGRVGYSRDS